MEWRLAAGFGACHWQVSEFRHQRRAFGTSQ
jgi:hypothetical protein